MYMPDYYPMGSLSSSTGGFVSLATPPRPQCHLPSRSRRRATSGWRTSGPQSLYPTRQPDQNEDPSPVPLVIDVARQPTTSSLPVAPRIHIELQAARPNPAPGATSLSYSIPETVAVRLAVYDAQGREIAVLAEGLQEAGWHDAVWTPGTAASGLYVVRLLAGSEVRTTTVVVVR